MDHRLSLAYHWATKHIRHRIMPHYLDFENYPDPVKSYDFLEKTGLAQQRSLVDADLNNLFTRPDQDENTTALCLEALGGILFAAYGVTGQAYAGGRPFFFRTAPSAGGLYPCHLYLVVREMDGLETGLYYCNMIHSFLGLIHKGKTTHPPKKESSFSLIVTGEFFKSAWKYRERALRYILLDAGHLMENICLAIKASNLCFSMSYDFDDEKMSQFLGLDPAKEVPLACVTVGQNDQTTKDPSEQGLTLTGLRAQENQPLAQGPSYALLQNAYELGTPAFQCADTGAMDSRVFAALPKKSVSLPDVQDMPGKISYKDTLISRRSKRNFIPRELGVHLSTALIRAISPLVGSLDEKAAPYLSLGVSCQNVQNMEDGVYLFSKDGSSLLQGSKGQYHKALSHVCLDQAWISNAAMNFLFMANLATLEKGLGPRGYRHVLMHAGRIAQRIYLAAAGLGLGCCGVGALYDEEAQSLLKLNPDSALFYVVCAGCVKR